jgi:DNA replicative helicase MCM subunit Mcm2 (Cdc46/Mcm family)
MPRTIDIVLRGEIVEMAKPGQMVKFSGSLIVVPDVAQMNSVGDRSEVVREAGSRRSSQISANETKQRSHNLTAHSALMKVQSVFALWVSKS